MNNEIAPVINSAMQCRQSPTGTSLSHDRGQCQKRYVCLVHVKEWPGLALIKIASDDGNYLDQEFLKR